MKGCVYMGLSYMAFSANEKREQRIMRLRKGFREKKFITVASAAEGMGGYSKATVEKWAKDGDIPLLKSNGKPVVPVTDKNSPKWLKEWLNGERKTL